MGRETLSVWMSGARPRAGGKLIQFLQTASRDPARDEILATAENCGAQLGIDRVFGYSQPGCDIPMRKAMKPPQREDFAAALRQDPDRFVQQLELLNVTGGFRGIGSLF